MSQQHARTQHQQAPTSGASQELATFDAWGNAARTQHLGLSRRDTDVPGTGPGGIDIAAWLGARPEEEPLATTRAGQTTLGAGVAAHPERAAIEAHETVHRQQYERYQQGAPAANLEALEGEAQRGSEALEAGLGFEAILGAPPQLTLAYTPDEGLRPQAKAEPGRGATPNGSGQIPPGTRQFLYTQLGQRTALAVDSFRGAAEAKVDELHAASQQATALGALVFDVTMSFAAPGLGTALAALVNSAGLKQTYSAVGTRSPDEVNRIGQFFVDLAEQAPSFVAAGTQIGKSYLEGGIAAAASEPSSEGFLQAAVQGFGEAVEAILDNAPTLSDESLLAIVGQFSRTVMTETYMSQKVEQMLQTFQRSVDDIAGPRRAAINLLEISKMTEQPKFLAACRYDNGDHDGVEYVVVEGWQLDQSGRVYELVPEDLVSAAVAAHHKEWQAPVPSFRFLGGGRVGP